MGDEESARSTSQIKQDGRRDRSKRTRSSVAGALLELLDEGVVHPTAEQIAERAGVSRRTIFNHFPQREALVEAALVRRDALLLGGDEIPRGLPLEQRIDRFLDQRIRVLARLTPLQRAARGLSGQSQALADRLRAAEDEMAAEVASVFAPEVRALPPESREAVMAALVAASAWTAWENYRAQQRLPAPAARAAMRSAIAALLAPDSS